MDDINSIKLEDKDIENNNIRFKSYSFSIESEN